MPPARPGPPLQGPEAPPPALLEGLPDRLVVRLATAPEPALFDAVERQREAAFGHPDRRRGFALGRTAARRAAAAATGLDPAAVRLVVAPDGAPELPGAGLHLSIAHAGKAAQHLAIAAVAPVVVGVDAERVRPVRPDLYTRILAPSEHALLGTFGPDPDAAQLLAWSLKEAVLKGLRTGFRRPARSVRLLEAAGGHGVAEADGRWALRYARHGAFWLAVAWRP